MKNSFKIFMILFMVILSLFALAGCEEGKKSQEKLEITAVTGKKVGDASFQLETTGGSGEGKVTFEQTSGTTVATVSSSGLVEILDKGSFKVKATKAEDDVYKKVTSAVLTIEIEEAEELSFTDVMNTLKNAESFSLNLFAYFWNEEEAELFLAYSDLHKIDNLKYETIRTSTDDEYPFFEFVDGNDLVIHYYNSYNYDVPTLVSTSTTYTTDPTVMEAFINECDKFRTLPYYYNEDLYEKQDNSYYLKKDQTSAKEVEDNSNFILAEDIINGLYAIEIYFEDGKIIIIETMSSEEHIIVQTKYIYSDFNTTSVEIPPVN